MRILLLLIFLTIIGCENKKYDVTGTIIEVRTDVNEFLIHHDEIPGFMMAMTMPFSLKDSLDIKNYTIGDSVQFKLIIKHDKALAYQFKLLGKGTISLPSNWLDDEYTAIEIGEIIQNVTLLNTDSNTVSLKESDGKFRLITYIFSRCPMPNMCPAAIIKNQYLAEEFKKENNIEFFIISFDYVYDTPSILKSNYSNLINNNPNIKIFSSTGFINDIYSLTGQSNVSFWGIDENDIGHNLRSILIDPERRLLKTFEGTDWLPQKAYRDIKNIIKTYNL